METHTVFVGDEDLNEEAAALIESVLGDNETLVAAAGFDSETKVIAITDLRVLIANGSGDIVLDLPHAEVQMTNREDRTLVIRTTDRDIHIHRFGSDQTVRELVKLTRQRRGARAGTGQTVVIKGRVSDESRHETRRAPVKEEVMDGTVSIADRVRFWEEQDRINQELIPRVIRQHELLTAHVADHENLPLVAGNAISEALADAREEQRQLYDAALEAAKQDMRQQYDSALEAARKEQREEYNKALDAAKTAIEGEARANLGHAVSTLNQEWRKTRNILVGISVTAVAIAILAFVAGVLI